MKSETFFWLHVGVDGVVVTVGGAVCMLHPLMSSVAGYKRKTANFCELRSQASPARHHNHRPTTRWLQSTSPTVICLAGASLMTMFYHRSYSAGRGSPRSTS